MNEDNLTVHLNWSSHYEALRNFVLGRLDESNCSCWGLALLINKGIKQWINTFSDRTAIHHTETTPSQECRNHVSADQKTEAMNLLTNIVLNHLEKKAL